MFSSRKFLTPCLLLLISFNAASAKNGDIGPQEIMAVAKIAGSCGILDSMIDFQKKTKMEGGNEFVTRFWAVEAARRGMSVEQLSTQCNSAVSSYDTLWKASEK